MTRKAATSTKGSSTVTTQAATTATTTTHPNPSADTIPIKTTKDAKQHAVVAEESSAFARGWSSLPTELNLHVLRHIILHGKILDIGFLSNLSVRELRLYKPLGRHYHWLWNLIKACIPNFSDLALDIILMDNTIHVRCCESEIASFPSEQLCNQVRRLKFIIPATASG
jgi:hypothetical protein